MAFEVAGVVIAEELATTLAADAALELMPLAFESFAPEAFSALAPEAFTGFGGETLASIFGNQAVPAAVAESFTPAAQSVLAGGAGAGEGITAITPGALETGAAIPEFSFSPEELNAISQGQADALASGPSPYAPEASLNQSQLVPSAPPTPGNASINPALQGNATLPNATPGANSVMNAPQVGVPSSAPTSSFGTLQAPTGPASLTPPTGDSGFMSGFSNFVDKHPFMTGAGIYGIANATGMLNQQTKSFNATQLQGQQAYNSPYKFDAANFKGSHPNPSQYWYTPKGPGYAGGGITQATSPNPSMMQSGPANVDFMGEDMYPTSQQHRSYYATPTQMPTSAQEAMAGYEPKTNPLTGEATANMASGGIAGYADGGTTGFGQGVTTALTPLQKLIASYSETGAIPTQDEYLGTMGLHSSFNPDYAFDKANGKFVPMSGITPMAQQVGIMGGGGDGGGGGGGGGERAGGLLKNHYASGGIAHYYRGELATSGGRNDVYGATQRFLDMTDPMANRQAPVSAPDVGIFHDTNPSTRDRTALQAAQIRQNALAKRAGVNTGANYSIPGRQMGQLSFATPGAKADKDSDSDQVLTGASGGIMGASLGGYAAGGNPRLLKGPGDGMSDDIPATIGNRQPARLADGEFVVPADVVSHLGNGSTEAGAKKLHGMMDKVRMDRTGKKKQAPAVKANKYIPK